MRPGAAALSLLVLAVIASAIAVVYQRHRHRQLFVELTTLERARDELNIEFGRLQLEQATLGETNRIEQIARTRLSMRDPDPAQVRLVPLPAAAEPVR